MLCALVLLGCGEGDVQIGIDQVPAPALKAAQDELRNNSEVYPVISAYKVKFEGRDAYEIRGQSVHGKSKLITVAADGTVLLKE